MPGPVFEETFLTTLDPRVPDELRARGRVQRFPPGAMLLYEGQVEPPVIVIFEGLAKVTALSSDARELLLAFRGPGALIGELAAMDHQPASATVAATNEVEAVLLSPGEFRGFLTEHPEAAIALVELLVRRLRDSDRKRVEFAALDTAGRVASRIVELVSRFGSQENDGSVSIALTLSQEELATWVGGSREATVKALAQLRDLGWIETGRRRIVVHDFESLRRRGMA